MRTLTLLLVLVAGGAGAQQGTNNCRSAASPCRAATFYSYAPSGTVGIELLDGSYIHLDAPSAAVFIRASGGVMQTGHLYPAASATYDFGGASNRWSNGYINSLFSNAGSGSTAISLQTGAWADLGGGANDRIKSDGTNVLVDTTLAPNSIDSADLGVAGSYWWRTLFVSRGIALNEGDTVKWTAPPISDNTTRTGQLVYNNAALEPVYGSSSRKYNPVGQSKEWAVEKRSMTADIGFESTTCPTASPMRGTGAGAVIFSCTDAAAATNVTVSGESYRQMNTTAVSNTVSITDVSAATTKLELGPKLIQRVSIPAGSTTNVRIWVALVPTATSLSGVDTGAISVVGFRFSTAVPDTNWQACSGNAASVTCTDTATAPTTATNLVLEIDCRELSTCRFLINGSLVATRSSSLPVSTTQLGHRVLVQTLTTTAKGLGYGRSNLQTN